MGPGGEFTAWTQPLPLGGRFSVRCTPRLLAFAASLKRAIALARRSWSDSVTEAPRVSRTPGCGKARLYTAACTGLPGGRMIAKTLLGETLQTWRDVRAGVIGEAKNV